MPIRALFLACMCTVAALATCLGGWVLSQMMVEYSLAGRVERAVEIDALLFVVSDKIGVERPIIGDALLMADPIDAATRARLAAIRQEADAALDAVEDHITGVSYPGAAAQLAVVRKIRADLTAWRQRVDEALSEPKSRRDPKIFATFIASLNHVFDATSGALDMGDLAASQHDGTAVELMILARHAWGIRAAMGVRTVPLMAAIDSGLPLDHDTLEGQARFDGVLATNWIPITSLARRLSGVPGVPEAIAAGRSAFDAYDDLCQKVIAAGRTSSTYPITALDLGRHVVSTAPLLLRIRDVALAASRARVADSREIAFVHVMIAAVVLASTMIAIIGVLIVLQRRIVSPMLALTRVIGQIARMDFDVEIPATERMDEIGHMAAALDALRQGAMAGEESKAQIVHMARHDALTGLCNRVALQDRLEQAVAMTGRGQTCAALCLDLDRFKAVNDTFGHPTGDLLLRQVAERLLACVREVDTVCRLGGDEFVVLLFSVNQPDQAAAVAQRIVRALSAPFDLDGQTVSIGASVGIAIAPRDANSAVTLLKCADTALYRAKSEAKGSWRFFQPEMDTHLRDRMELERDLRDAVGDEAFELAFQPQYQLASDPQAGDRLCGFEALLRWPHPRRGVIGPAEFITVAEETGLIVPIGAWVLRHACAEAMHWPDDVKLAVNLSGVQFRNLALVPMVREALVESGLPARRLELEVTETVLLANGAPNLALLHELRALGVGIAMDDFGTGYSSLSSIRGFPFDRIKIDRSFVRDLSDDAGARAIVGAVVTLAGSLGMATTAEGVETADQVAELRRHGCTHAQGYLFGKPMRGPETRNLAASRAMADGALA